ncbi:DNA-binding protein [Bradyrhizobium sp. AZCC 2230]|uniref:DNA-binding protein n=1 Tax=Bradyrhizobium sp. AZCC 2230 TaxID=3117021 RepID=UPI002FF10AE9
MTIQTENTTSTLDTIVWGADAIAPHLGRTVKGTYCALEGGKVPGAKKIAGRWALSLRIFHGSFEVRA